MPFSRKIVEQSAFLIVGFTVIAVTYFWKRKKPGDHCDTGGNNECTATQQQEEQLTNQTEETKPETIDASQELKRSQSLPCANNNSTPVCDSIDRQSGKSAPINIAPNPRSPPKKLTERDIDVEILKLKLTETDLKNLSSIEELADESSSVDSSLNLPGSVQPCRFSSSMPKVHEEPVEVKAAKMTNASNPNANKLTAERDSANHSPVESIDSNGNCNGEKVVQEVEECTREGPIASPPLSLCSLQSADSGKGSSPTRSDGGNIVYDFTVPNALVQHLIGTKGRYVKQLKAKTGVKMTMLQHPTSKKLYVCSLEGTQKEIDAALRMLRQKMPERRYPLVTLERVFVIEPNAPNPLPATTIPLPLIEGINNDVSICAVISGGHVFLQQPLHPSYSQLSQLQLLMNQGYSCFDAPQLEEFNESSICAAPITTQNGMLNWVRVEITSDVNLEAQLVTVKYLDYGGYGTHFTYDLRQIRLDFMTVPFQSTEVFMADIAPSDPSGWHEDAKQVLLSLTYNKIIQAQVVGYTEKGTPEVFLFATLDNDNVVFLNEELVARKLAIKNTDYIATA